MEILPKWIQQKEQTIAGKKSGKTKKGIWRANNWRWKDKQEIISNIPKSRVAGNKEQRQGWVLVCQKMAEQK